MKPAAFFITILMLFFIAQPLLIECRAAVQVSTESSSCCQSAGSCEKKKAQKKTSNKDCEGTSSCNPFASCSQCPYTNTHRLLPHGPELSLTKKRVLQNSANTSAGFPGDWWQPPEKVSLHFAI